jgi:Family of unknown function (DUF5317)
VLVIVCLLLAVLAVPLTGGRLSRLAALRWRRGWLLLLALAVQVVIVEVPGLPVGASAAVHVATYAAAGTFVWLNRHVAGLCVLAAGAACNGVTIALNGGTLPSTRSAMSTAGITPDPGFVNSGPVAHPVLLWLGDVFAVPAGLPLANVFSVGDVIIVVGAAWVVHRAARRPPVLPPTAEAATLPG